MHEFLGTLIIVLEKEHLTSYPQYLHTYPNREAIAVELCTPGAIDVERRGSFMEDSAEGLHHLGLDLERVVLLQLRSDLPHVRH